MAPNIIAACVCGGGGQVHITHRYGHGLKFSNTMSVWSDFTLRYVGSSSSSDFCRRWVK